MIDVTWDEICHTVGAASNDTVYSTPALFAAMPVLSVSVLPSNNWSAKSLSGIEIGEQQAVHSGHRFGSGARYDSRLFLGALRRPEAGSRSCRSIGFPSEGGGSWPAKNQYVTDEVDHRVPPENREKSKADQPCPKRDNTGVNRR